MKQHLARLAAVALLIIGTAGCAALAPVGNFIAGGTLGQQAPATYLQAKKLLTTAEDAQYTTGVILEASAKTGLLHGQNALTAKNYYDQAGVWLDKAEAAKKVLDAPGMIAAIDAAAPFLDKANIAAKGQ